MTLVDLTEDTDLSHLEFEEEEIPCVSKDGNTAKWRGVLSCGHSFLVCDKCARKCMIIRDTTHYAKCAECHQTTTLTALEPIT